MNKNPKKKKFTINWKKHFLEFIMLFLAIFLGFFADNLREQSSDRSKEKEYIKSMIEDVKTDKKNIQIAIKNNRVRKIYLDSLSNLSFNYDLINNNDRSLYQYYPAILQRPDFLTPSELTLQQLKNAGGMRFIKNNEAINAVLTYDSKLKKLANQQKYYENYHKNSINLGLKIFNHKNIRVMQSLLMKTGKIDLTQIDLNEFDFKLLENNNSKISEFGNTVDMYAGIVNYYIMLLLEVDKQADSLITKLNTEYRLE